MKKIWILIRSRGGIFYEPEIFYAKENAVKRKSRLMKHFNRDYDEIEIFEKKTLMKLMRRN